MSTKVIVENATIIDNQNPSVTGISCALGYRPAGPLVSYLIRNPDGTERWDPPKLVCVPIETFRVPTVENGIIEKVERKKNVVGPPYIIHDQAIVKCYNGYETNEKVALLIPKPNKQMKWFPPSISCKPMQTEKRPKAVNGSIEPQRTHDEKLYISPISLAFNDYVNIKCNSGYESKLGTSKLSVDQNNQLVWQPDTLSCQPKSLMIKPVLRNGQYIVKNPPYFYGDQAKIQCNPGFESLYEKEYAEVIEEGNQLKWRPTTLYCQPMALNVLPVVINGTAQLKNPSHLSKKSYPVGTQVTIICDPDHFTVETESTIVIDPKIKTLKWQPNRITCKRLNCPEPPKANYRINRTGGRNFGDRITYRCIDNNYEIVGKFKKSKVWEPIIYPEYQCYSDGRWKPELPNTFDCEIVHCPKLDKPNATYLEYSRILNGVATYTCAIDKTMVTTRTCQSDGTWSGKEPTCPPIHNKNPLIWIFPIILLICLVAFLIVNMGGYKVFFFTK